MLMNRGNYAKSGIPLSHRRSGASAGGAPAGGLSVLLLSLRCISGCSGPITFAEPTAKSADGQVGRPDVDGTQVATQRRSREPAGAECESPWTHGLAVQISGKFPHAGRSRTICEMTGIHVAIAMFGLAILPVRGVMIVPLCRQRA